MNLVSGFTIIGISACVFLAFLFLLKSKGQLVSNQFLGVFFLLLAVRLGKLLAQDHASENFLTVYFNLMHGAFFMLGPTIWLYSRTYFSQSYPKEKSVIFHFIPSLLFLTGAFHFRQFAGESVWIFLYWIIQIHPFLYVLATINFLTRKTQSENLTPTKMVWLYSLLGVTLLIPTMNILYFTLNFPFYIVINPAII